MMTSSLGHCFGYRLAQKSENFAHADIPASNKPESVIENAWSFDFSLK